MGLKDILASKGKRRILTKMFRPPIFANTIFSQSFNLGGFLALFRFGIMFTPSSCLWACDRHFQVWGGALCTLFGVGGVASPPFWGWEIVSPLFWDYWVVSPFWSLGFWWGLVFCTSPISFKVCIFHDQKTICFRHSINQESIATDL